MGLIASLIAFVVGVIVGAFGIYVGAGLITGTEDFGRAVSTAVVGSIVWTVAGVAFGGIPLLGPLLTFAAYLAVLKWQYRCEWASALGIALFAWLTVVVASVVLGTVFAGFDAVGVPGI